MEVSVSAGLGHINDFMHPQVLITDDPSREDGFFTKAIRMKALELSKPVIELPTDASENLMWITQLDSSSLAGKTLILLRCLLINRVAAWHTTYVDILIHAPRYLSGSLLRLLRSIEAADYFGHRRPHLTIELPPDVDPPTMRYLEELVWPPIDWSGVPHASQVTLRHRIPPHKSTAEEASIRLVESFYPTRPKDSHVLVLSPQVELSPLYFHFLTYQLLEYRYSTSARENSGASKLMGLSLELPYMHLNDTTPFSPPTRAVESKESEKAQEKPAPFLWQAPNSNAALYFGDKWIEFHSFLTSRISHEPTTTLNRPKMISDIYPSWLEYALELMRARGYTLLYPNFSSSNRESIASLHMELFQPPEEYTPDPPKKPASTNDEPIPTLDPHETFQADPSTHSPKKPNPHRESTPLTTTLTALLPASKSISTSLSDLPLLTYQGNPESDPLAFESVARIFAIDFRRSAGKCSPGIILKRPEIEPMSADDLFCDADENSKGGGLGWGELPTADGGSRGRMSRMEKVGMDVVMDDSEVRQAEFEAHLSRQGGEEGGDVENSKEDVKAEVKGKESNEDGEDVKGKKKEDMKEEEKPEVKDRGW
ncbi:MAG: hypothetical protein Q9220_002848 [cf. Caloplaca sp. 1 TL-2023]